MDYLVTTKEYGIKYHTGATTLTGFADAAFANRDGARSQIGILTMLGGNVIHWGSNKTKVVAVSSSEAEYVALSELGREIKAQINMYKAINEKINIPIQLYEDNKSTIAMGISNSYTKRSRHIDVQYHYIRQLIEKGIVKINYLQTEQQIADILTKPLPRPLFTRLRKMMGMTTDFE